jgi:DNA processing protein
MPTPRPPVDPEAVQLCQIPGMRASLLARPIERWGTAAAILRAPSTDLRALGLPPALVARIVAAPRQRAATEAGLKSFERMGFIPVTYLGDDYPARLRQLPDPPLMLYIQGTWPIPPPIVALARTEARAEQDTAPVSELLAALAERGIHVAAVYDDAALLPSSGSAALLPFGLLLARSRVRDSLREAATGGQSTLLSVAPINAPNTPAAEETARQTLIAIADGLIVAGEAPLAAAHGRAELHTWIIKDGPAEQSRRSKGLHAGAAGAETIARALGVRPAGDTTVRQERLW